MRSSRIVIFATLPLLGAAAYLGTLVLQRNASAQPLPACSDGIDNDGDLLVDLADPGCFDGDGSSEVDTPDAGAPRDSGTGVVDLGPPDLSTGFTDVEGGAAGGGAGPPTVDSPQMPARDTGCAYAAASTPSVRPWLIGMMLLVLLTRRMRRAP